MYEAFFRLENSPFVLTPDPRFLFRSKGHHEILASLLYGITSQKGLMALIGDVGTGKTTLCRALLRELPKEVQSALVLNPHLSETELIGAILDDLGVERQGATKGDLMTRLGDYLLAAGEEGKTVVVILDEAQQMSVEALEQIRILSNLETPTQKLLQIILVGQPELEEKLKRPELRQLDQRIAIRCYLRPLSKKETFRYIEHRLRVAGLMATLPFTSDAMTTIYHFSHGIPRLINLLCDRALMAGYGARSHQITSRMVRAAIRNLEGRKGRRRMKSGSPALAAGILGALLVAGAGAAYWSGWPDRIFGRSSRPMAAWTVDTSWSRLRSWMGRAPGEGKATAAVDAPAQPVRASALEAARPELPRPTTPQTLVAQLLSLWGISEDLSDEVTSGWPGGADGSPDIPRIAARYQLAATFLPETSVAELRAIGLPALLELTESGGRGQYLLKRMEGDMVVLVTPSRDEVRYTAGTLEPLWPHSAWVLWRNVDELPVDPIQEMSPTVLATLALRLQKLGYLTPPLPALYDGRVAGAVRAFQRKVGLSEDGIMGPRTTLALSRVVGGRFNPTIIESGAK